MCIKCGRELNIKLNLFSVTENAREFCFCLFKIWCDVNYFPVFHSIGNKKIKQKIKQKMNQKKNLYKMKTIAKVWCLIGVLLGHFAIKSVGNRQLKVPRNKKAHNR